MAYPNPQLIDALRTTADKIESGEWDNYWGAPEQCNCGLLARTILGEPLHFGEQMGTWQGAVQFLRGDGWMFESFEPKCQSTGLLFADIVDLLSDVGLQDEDLVHLERLNGEPIVEAMDTTTPNRRKDEHVVEYLRTWADLLEEARPLADEAKADEADESTAETPKRPEADPIPA
jgi:hypothetical protein